MSIDDVSMDDQSTGAIDGNVSEALWKPRGVLELCSATLDSDGA
jgi:hypothetical protein